MSQQSVIFAALFIGFVVYITARGRLPAYVALFWTKGAPASAPASQTVTLGTAANPSTYGPMGTPSGPVSQSGFQNVPIPGL